MELELKTRLDRGDLDDTLALLYGTDLAPARARCHKVISAFEAAFGEAPENLFSAPGRTELGGNHTDHQRGRVLAAGVDLDILAAVKPNHTGVVRFASEGYPMISVDLRELEPKKEEENTSAALIRGVAARMAQLGCPLGDQGLDAAAIAAELEKEKKDIRLVALLDTLEYLKRGGRISPSVALVGGLLSVKPVVAVERGEVVMLGKARGSKNGNNLLVQEIRKTSGVDFDRPYLLGYTGLEDSLLQKYIADSAALWTEHTDALPIGTIGGTIGTHVGPGAVAVAFFQQSAK